MVRLAHDIESAQEYPGKLLPEQHEDDAVERELHGVPHGRTLHSRRRERLALQLGIAHRDARRHGGKDAGAAQVLRQFVRAERNQQAQHDLRTDFLAEAADHPALRQHHAVRQYDAGEDADDRELRESDRG